MTPGNASTLNHLGRTNIDGRLKTIAGYVNPAQLGEQHQTVPPDRC